MDNRTPTKRYAPDMTERLTGGPIAAALTAKRMKAGAITAKTKPTIAKIKPSSPKRLERFGAAGSTTGYGCRGSSVRDTAPASWGSGTRIVAQNESSSL